MSRAVTAVVLMILSASPALRAQSCQLRPVIVNVLDAHGVPITGLTSANFKASYQGHALNITSESFRADPSVRTVVLVGDTAPGKIAKPAALEFISTAPSQAPISMFTFSAAVERRFNSGEGRQPMEDWLKAKDDPSQRTHRRASDLAGTLLSIVKAMKPAHMGDAIYVITGNSDALFFPAGSRQVPPIVTDLANELEASGIRLFVLVLEVVPQRGWDVISPSNNLVAIPHTPTGAAVLADLVRGSGGLGLNWHPTEKSVSFAASFDYDSGMQGAVRQSARGFLSAIRNFYVLTLAAPEHSPALGDWKLEVVDSHGKNMKDVTVAYPATVQGCPSSSTLPK